MLHYIYFLFFLILIVVFSIILIRKKEHKNFSVEKQVVEKQVVEKISEKNNVNKKLEDIYIIDDNSEYPNLLEYHLEKIGEDKIKLVFENKGNDKTKNIIAKLFLEKYNTVLNLSLTSKEKIGEFEINLKEKIQNAEEITSKRKTTRIPKRIVQTYKTNNISYGMYKASRSFINLNSEYEYVFYDDNDCREFIIKNYKDESYIKAYDSLIPGAYKADIFRLCELYINGGIYTDVSMVCRKKLDFIYKDVDLVFVIDFPSGNNSYIYNAVICAVAKSDAIKFILDKTVETVLNKEFIYEKNSLCLTGPGVFGRFLNLYLGNRDDSIFREGLYKHNLCNILFLRHEGSVVKLKKEIYIQTKYKNWLKDRKNSAHYGKLFKSGKIFHDDKKLNF